MLINNGWVVQVEAAWQRLLTSTEDSTGQSEWGGCKELFFVQKFGFIFFNWIGRGNVLRLCKSFEVKVNFFIPMAKLKSHTHACVRIVLA